MSIGRFRSITAFASGTRAAAPPIDRATFVLFAIAGHRFAVAVERVERILRVSDVAHAVNYAGRTLPLTDLASSLGLGLAPSTQSRIIVFNDDTRWIAAEVDTVLEVLTIDAAQVKPVSFDGAGGYVPVGARGIIIRHDVTMLVLDVTRALRATTHFGPVEYVDPFGLAVS